LAKPRAPAKNVIPLVTLSFGESWREACRFGIATKNSYLFHNAITPPTAKHQQFCRLFFTIKKKGFILKITTFAI
jgi:hypothetical protein